MFKIDVNSLEFSQIKKMKEKQKREREREQQGLLDQITDKMSNMYALILRKLGDWVHKVSGVFATQSITLYQNLAWNRSARIHRQLLVPFKR